MSTYFYIGMKTEIGSTPHLNQEDITQYNKKFIADNA